MGCKGGLRTDVWGQNRVLFHLLGNTQVCFSHTELCTHEAYRKDGRRRSRSDTWGAQIGSLIFTGWGDALKFPMFLFCSGTADKTNSATTPLFSCESSVFPSLWSPTNKEKLISSCYIRGSLPSESCSSFPSCSSFSPSAAVWAEEVKSCTNIYLRSGGSLIRGGLSSCRFFCCALIGRRHVICLSPPA